MIMVKLRRFLDWRSLDSKQQQENVGFYSKLLSFVSQGFLQQDHGKTL